MIKQTLILVTFLISSFLFSQNSNQDNKNSPVNEQIIIQTNNDFYLSGESIFYKTICLNASSKEIFLFSKIAYVELVNSENVLILRHKQIIEKGISFNDFFIPTNIETGSYKIITYTNLSQKNNDYSEKEIFILNPYLSFPEKYKDTNVKKEITALLTAKNKSHLNINLNKKEYRKREKVSINFSDNLEGNFVLNVIKTDSVPVLQETKNNTLYSQIKKDILNNNAINLLIPENRGEIFTGKITAKNGDINVENKKIALSIPGENFDFKISTTNQNGEFKFVLDNFNGEEAYFQVFEKDKEKYKIEVTEAQSLKTKTTVSNIKINSVYAEALLKRSIANQIQNIYYHTKSDTVFAYKKSKPFYYGADKEYLLKDYNPQNTVKEIFVEIIPEVYISKKDGKQTFNVNDYVVNDSDIYYNTLVLIDGFLLQEFEELLTFDPTYFTKINFVNKGYFLNKYLFNGVVNLTTKDFNYIPKTEQDYIIKKNLERPQLNKKYYQLDYSKNSFDKIPDYRYQLCWEPNITKISTQKMFEFYTSDISGNYKIILEGITKNGESIFIENYIQVK